MSLENIKQEAEWGLSEAASRTGLYEKHEIKNGLVLGPVVLQLPDVAYYNSNGHYTGNVKIEKDSSATNTTAVTAAELGLTAKNLSVTNRSSATPAKLGLTPTKKGPTTAVPALTTKEMGCKASELDVKTEPQWDDEWAVTSLRDQKMKQELLKSLELRAADNVKGLHLMKPDTMKSRDTGGTKGLKLDKHLRKRGIEFTNINSPNITKSGRIRSRPRIRFEGDSDTEEEIKERKTRSKKIHKCEYCGKQFPFRSTLTNHIRIHTGEKPHKCQVCSKRFSDYAVLCRHRKVHTGEKPHKCNICGNKYSEKYLLKNHKLIHTGEMKYFCKECPKTFVNSSNFRRHQWVHKHKYTCDICQRKFAKKPLLASHIINHLKPNSKVFKCDFCDKTFGMMGHLNRHLAIHMGPKEVYTCGACMKDFTQHSSLKRHVIKRVCIKNKLTMKSMNSKETS